MIEIVGITVELPSQVCVPKQERGNEGTREKAGEEGSLSAIRCFLLLSSLGKKEERSNN